METRKEFKRRVQAGLKQIDQAALLHNENEFWLIQHTYEYIEHRAYMRQLYNTALALPLMRGLHNGTYRKFGIVKDGEEHRLPYYIHCLMVCKMLVDVDCGLSPEDEDIMLAAALCHDAIEDLDFPKGGRELYETYGLDKRVYETVLLVSKTKEQTAEDERRYYEGIKADRLALLVKLADRGNNVEDLYNMSVKKTREYIEETKQYFLPMIAHGIAHYPESADGIRILGDKITILINISEATSAMFDSRLDQLRNERNQLKLENIRLREIFRQQREEDMADE